MESKLVPYIVGYEVNKESYKILTPCEDANETNCYVAH